MSEAKLTEAPPIWWGIDTRAEWLREGGIQLALLLRSSVDATLPPSQFTPLPTDLAEVLGQAEAAFLRSNATLEWRRLCAAQAKHQACAKNAESRAARETHLATQALREGRDPTQQDEAATSAKAEAETAGRKAWSMPATSRGRISATA